MAPAFAELKVELERILPRRDVDRRLLALLGDYPEAYTPEPPPPSDEHGCYLEGPKAV